MLSGEHLTPTEKDCKTGPRRRCGDAHANPPCHLVVVLALGLMLPAWSAEDGRSDVVSKTCGGGRGQLVIAADRGSLEVEGGDRGEVVIEATRKVVRGSDSAAELLRRHKVTFSEENGTIPVEPICQVTSVGTGKAAAEVTIQATCLGV
jgi:hypothetical protein